ncbi:hypothetical protein [Rubellicoccus peritrichatus]|uniref:Septum formation inhibitor Maf n=1 Tax=Rubellicoccus peritrichatus TaxID=3080537 RepID=A0AAQ3L6U3_9BACT|nr:hypothetical protein [Puniceicoccus sp. CR14]WOO39732.1 hypothetical protein RZN69_14000 [Puniceicoccus sp. CR14]
MNCFRGRLKWSWWPLFSTILLVGLSACAGEKISTDSMAVTEAQIQDYWFDGAEISRFDLEQSRYGAEHQGTAEFIFVTEPFLVSQQVKHEFGNGKSVPVLKLNALRTFNTGIYSYRTMLSVFDPLPDEGYSHALKTTLSVQDWCGQVFYQMNYRDSAWKAELRSYFQGEADQDFSLESTWLEDEIWTTIRIDPESLPVGEFSMIPSALYLRFQHIEPSAHTAIGKLEENDGLMIYAINYPELGRTLEISFEKEFPFVINGWTELQEGEKVKTVAKRTHLLRNRYYWSEHDNKDRKSRKLLGLEPDLQ